MSVTVAADFGLVGDPAQSAVVTIQDKPFDGWRFSHFTAAELAEPAISGDAADPDGDQLANLIEYALDLSPKSPSPLPAARLDAAGYLAISVTIKTAASDILWNAEISSQLDQWQPAVITTDTPSAFAARDSVLQQDAPKRFIRLQITRP